MEEGVANILKLWTMIKKYFRLTVVLIKINLAYFAAYRANFFSSMIADLSWSIFLLLSMVFLTSRVKQIGSWNRTDILMLTCAANIILGFLAIIAKNFFQFANTVHMGKLDTILLKPVDSQFLMSFQHINPSKLARIIMCVCIMIYLAVAAKLSISFLQVVIFTVLLLAGFVATYSLWFAISAITIWYSKLSNLTDLLFEVTNTMRYPRDVFFELNIMFGIFLIPLTFFVVPPTEALLGKNYYSGAIVLLISTVVLYFLSRSFWRRALRSYTSVNS